MKNFALMAAALVLGFTLSIGDAEAKRLGGGGSSGMQRQSVTPNTPPTAAKPAQLQPPAPAAAPASATQTFVDGSARRSRRRSRSCRTGFPLRFW
jgi:hypothetical protein